MTFSHVAKLCVTFRGTHSVFFTVSAFGEHLLCALHPTALEGGPSSFSRQRDRAPGKRPVPRTESRRESAGAAFPGASMLKPQTGGLMHRNLQSPSPGDQKSHIKAAAKPAPAEARGELCTGPRPGRWRSWGSSAHDAAVISTRPSLCAHVSTRPLSQGHQYVGVRLTLLCTTSR